MKLNKILSHILFALLALASFNNAQPERNLSSSEIKLALKKLNVLGSVLYIAAHPDDENTAVLSYFASGKMTRTGYLSLTRGDGGQNLIGSEQSDELGVIRTQELLEARKKDGAEQFFSRAIDFGYSKTAEETFKIWGKDEILSDVVYIIRKFRPDIIINRFPTDGNGGHGHHTASAILAIEAFKIANDKNAFPEQLKYVDTWQPKRIFWNAWMPLLEQRGDDLSKLISVNLGDFNSLLGMSYTEISAISRTMHKSQGFGSGGRRDEVLNYFQPLEGSDVKNDLLEDIDISWSRVKGGNEIGKMIESVIEKFDHLNPSSSIPDLVSIYQKISLIDDKYWKEVKLKELKEIIRSCAGIWIEAISKDFFASPGDKIDITTGIVNRSDRNITLKQISVSYADEVVINSVLQKGKMHNNTFTIQIPVNAEVTQPFWLSSEHRIGIYEVDDQRLIAKAENDPVLIAWFTIEINGQEIDYQTPVYHRRVDPVDGEIYRPLLIAPPVTLNFDKDVYLFPDNNEREIRLNLKSFKENTNGRINLSVNNGWKIDPAFIDFSIESKYQTKQVIVKVIPTKDFRESELKAEMVVDGKTFSNSLIEISYPHIMQQTLFPHSKSKLVRLDIGDKVVYRIGYINGSGDKIPEYLRELGFTVDILSDDDLLSKDLNEYKTIIAGIRAYNTRDVLSSAQKRILEFIYNGGNYVVQYQIGRGIITFPSPYLFEISRDRVTDENSDVTLLNSNSSLLSRPNKISDTDFLGWIQERGLYFASDFNENYQSFLAMNDEGESPKDGSLIKTNYGKGTFIYTGLSFFRQIPAGVPGAIRLFVNLISAGVND
ncbi:MAG: PIG-L family deacetylase [Ignavibacterium sp.]|nr:PIG-L family deacetylase [Ignavibacterium sp.]